jgi:hypothetical protein
MRRTGKTLCAAAFSRVWLFRAIVEEAACEIQSFKRATDRLKALPISFLRLG